MLREPASIYTARVESWAGVQLPRVLLQQGSFVLPALFSVTLGKLLFMAHPVLLLGPLGRTYSCRVIAVNISSACSAQAFTEVVSFHVDIVPLRCR